MGGVEKRIYEIGRRLANRGHDVHHYCMKYWEGPETIRNNDGVTLHGVCLPQALFANDRRSIREAIYFAVKVFKPLSRERFDIIDVQNFPYFPTFSAKASQALKRSKLIITWHEVWDKYWYEYMGQIGVCGQLIERVTATLSRRPIAVSNLTKEQLVKIGVNENRIELIPNGIDFMQLEKVQSSHEPSDLIYAGRLIKEKGINVLIEAVNTLRHRFPTIKCLIIGDGPEKENLVKMVADLGIMDNIQFKPFLDKHEELIGYIKSSKVFILPSSREGFGIVVIEANGCGIPVITTNHDHNAARYLIIPGKNGYLFGGDSEELANAIADILQNHNDWAGSCKEQAKIYDWDSIVDLLESWYFDA